MGGIRHFRELNVYQNAMDLAVEIFQLTLRFPPSERFSLTDQVRRSSRSVCANIGEAWRKRRYTAAFVSKLNDAEAEAAETQVWLEMSLRIKVIDQETFEELDRRYDHVISQLVRMIDSPEKWCVGIKKEAS